MMSSWSVKVFLLCLLCTGLCWAFPESQVELVREVFENPVSRWSEILTQNSKALDNDFLAKVKARIDWAFENDKFDDAARFALLGDLAAEVIGRPQVYRRGLIDLLKGRAKPEDASRVRQLEQSIALTEAPPPPLDPEISVGVFASSDEFADWLSDGLAVVRQEFGLSQGELKIVFASWNALHRDEKSALPFNQKDLPVFAIVRVKATKIVGTPDRWYRVTDAKREARLVVSDWCRLQGREFGP